MCDYKNTMLCCECTNLMHILGLMVLVAVMYTLDFPFLRRRVIREFPLTSAVASVKPPNAPRSTLVKLRLLVIRTKWKGLADGPSETNRNHRIMFRTENYKLPL